MIPETLQSTWKQLNGPQVTALTTAIQNFYKEKFDDYFEYLNSFSINTAVGENLTTIGLLLDIIRVNVNSSVLDSFWFVLDWVSTSYDEQHGFAEEYAIQENGLPLGGIFVSTEVLFNQFWFVRSVLTNKNFFTLKVSQSTLYGFDAINFITDVRKEQQFVENWSSSSQSAVRGFDNVTFLSVDGDDYTSLLVSDLESNKTHGFSETFTTLTSTEDLEQGGIFLSLAGKYNFETGVTKTSLTRLSDKLYKQLLTDTSNYQIGSLLYLDAAITTWFSLAGYANPSTWGAGFDYCEETDTPTNAQVGDLLVYVGEFPTASETSFTSSMMQEIMSKLCELGYQPAPMGHAYVAGYNMEE